MPKYKTYEERVAGFESRVSQDAETGCWNWTGEIKHNGYGECWVFGRRDTPHREAYRVYVGPIPEGMMVRHQCDNRKCCNPAHLLIGTQADNMRDKVSRGRQARGSRHGCAKLNEDQVRAIRASLISNKKLGPMYGVTPEMISSIKRRKAWKHLE